MRRLTLLLVSLVLLSIQSVLAQSFSVKGTVVSAEDNEPMIGVTIMQEGTSNGVVTDIDGNYTIEIKGASKATLAYSYVGCVTQKHVSYSRVMQELFNDPAWVKQNINQSDLNRKLYDTLFGLATVISLAPFFIVLLSIRDLCLKIPIITLL